MIWFKFTLWTYLVFTLHSALASGLAIAGQAPSLVLAGWVLMSSRMTGRQGLLAAAVWGLLTDCLTEGRLGAGIVCLSLATWVLQQSTARWNRSQPWKLAAVTVPLIWADMVAMAVLYSQFDGRPYELRGFCIHAAGSAVYTGLIIAAAESGLRFVRGNSTEDAAVAAPAVSNKWRMLTE